MGIPDSYRLEMDGLTERHEARHNCGSCAVIDPSLAYTCRREPKDAEEYCAEVYQWFRLLGPNEITTRRPGLESANPSA